MKYKKILLLAFLLQFVFAFGVMAADTGSINFEESTNKQFQQIEIPGLDPIKNIGGDFVALKQYISAIYKVAMGITGILAVIVLALGGITWLTSGGNATQIGKAKQYIWGSMTGLILALLSYTLLYTVNPDIVNFKMGGGVTSLSRVAMEGCDWQKRANGCLPGTGESPEVKCNSNKINSDDICCCPKRCSELKEAECRKDASCLWDQTRSVCVEVVNVTGDFCLNNSDTYCSSGLICNMWWTCANPINSEHAGCCGIEGEGGAKCKEDTDCKNGYKCLDSVCQRPGVDICNKCGEGILNICDQEECEAIGPACIYSIRGSYTASCISK